MLMLDREAGAAERFALLDTAAVQADPTWDERTAGKAEQAAADCAAILEAIQPAASVGQLTEEAPAA